eukprot:m.744210 g.744210  ORF g.744210 m.744210 type:complete len:103 (+) comp23123_c1_seq6:537-845(+)
METLFRERSAAVHPNMIFTLRKRLAMSVPSILIPENRETEDEGSIETDALVSRHTKKHMIQLEHTALQEGEIFMTTKWTRRTEIKGIMPNQNQNTFRMLNRL